MAKLNCDEEPLRKLRKAVLQKYGKLYGMLLKEVNIALSQRAKILENDQCQNTGRDT